MEHLGWAVKIIIETGLAMYLGVFILHKGIIGFNYLLRYLIKMLKGEE